MKNAVSVLEYISSFPPPIRKKLKQLRAIIRINAPEAEEMISYGMPAYKLNGPLVYFAGYKNHIGFYPTPAPILAFKKELLDFKTSKGAIQLPADKKLPVQLIEKLVKYKVMANKEKFHSKKK